MFVELRDADALPSGVPISKFFTQYWNPSVQEPPELQASLLAERLKRRFNLPGQLGGCILSILEAPLQDLRLELICLIADLEELAEDARSELPLPSQAIVDRRDALKERLEELREGMNQKRFCNMDEIEANVFIWIRAHVTAYERIIHIFLSVMFETTQSSFDRYISEFNAVVKCAQAAASMAENAKLTPAIVSEFPISKPLFITAVRF